MVKTRPLEKDQWVAKFKQNLFVGHNKFKTFFTLLL